MPVARLPISVRPLLLGGLLLLAVLPAHAHAGALKVPDVVLGPESGETAVRVDAPIVEVTVYSDRARVRRRGRVTVKAGAGVVRLPDVAGAAFLDTVRVAATAGRVLRVEATPIERERLEIEQATKLLDGLDAVNDRLAKVGDRAAVDEWEVGAVTRLRPAPPVAEDKREGRKGLTVDVASWWKALDFLGARTTAARTRLARVADERRELDAERDRLRAEIAKLNQGGFSDRSVQVIAVLEPAGTGPVEVELEYFVPGARWKPAYNLHFSSARGQLVMETVAVVEQTTGENWEKAAVSFSTATPGRGIDLPELLTWTLGERSEFVPIARPRKPPRAEPVLPMPPGRSPMTEARAIDAELVRERLARALASPSAREVTASATVSSSRGDDERARATKAKREISELVAEAVSDRPRKRALSGQKSTTESDDSDGTRHRDMEETLEGSAPEAPPPMPVQASASPSSPSASTESLSWQDVAVVPRKMNKKSGAAYRSAPVPLSLIDATSARQPPTFTDPYLPAVSGGGLDYVYRAPTAATVESTGKEVRIPLASQAFKTAAFYEASPALAATAFLRARVRNDGKRPLLRGPATIFGDGEFVGLGEIKTTGPSGDIEFPLGADQDIRLVRQVVPSGKTTGLIIKSQETVYEVQIQIGNYKKQPVTVEVIEQVPKTQNDDIAVKLLQTDPAPLGAPDPDGVFRWKVTVAAGETRTLKLRYQITRPKDWKLYQR